jgi:hypothetical protein
MRKLSKQRIEELNTSGVIISSESGPYKISEEVTNKSLEEAVTILPEEAAKKELDYTQTLLSLLDKQEQTQNILAEYGKTVADTVAEMNKPKPKKNYKCAVQRGSDGLINVIDIEEK